MRRWAYGGIDYYVFAAVPTPFSRHRFSIVSDCFCGQRCGAFASAEGDVFRSRGRDASCSRFQDGEVAVQHAICSSEWAGRDSWISPGHRWNGTGQAGGENPAGEVPRESRHLSGCGSLSFSRSFFDRAALSGCRHGTGQCYCDPDYHRHLQTTRHPDQWGVSRTEVTWNEAVGVEWLFVARQVFVVAYCRSEAQGEHGTQLRAAYVLT